jgi:hypothetical protein
MLLASGNGAQKHERDEPVASRHRDLSLAEHYTVRLLESDDANSYDANSDEANEGSDCRGQITGWCPFAKATSTIRQPSRLKLTAA